MKKFKTSRTLAEHSNASIEYYTSEGWEPVSVASGGSETFEYDIGDMGSRYIEETVSYSIMLYKKDMTQQEVLAFIEKKIRAKMVKEFKYECKCDHYHTMNHKQKCFTDIIKENGKCWCSECIRARCEHWSESYSEPLAAKLFALEEGPNKADNIIDYEQMDIQIAETIKSLDFECQIFIDYRYEMWQHLHDWKM